MELLLCKQFFINKSKLVFKLLDRTLVGVIFTFAEIVSAIYMSFQGSISAFDAALVRNLSILMSFFSYAYVTLYVYFSNIHTHT